MARKTWVQDPITHKLIPKEEYAPRGPSGPFVMGDISPYQSMITGEMIQGRRQHREHLQQHGCIEVGNEKIKPRKVVEPSREDYRRSVAEIMNGKGY
ncbi:Uncharacterised protein [Bordetella bronchiseptica]|nr:Uncharacterised protein [Bordetella bronchiseptica]